MKRYLVAAALVAAFTVSCAEQHDEQYTTVLAPLGADDREVEIQDEVAQTEEHRYVFEIPVGATYVIIELSGSATGDADVFAKLNELATLADYDCGPQLSTSDELCLFLQDLESAELNITVRGFALLSPYNLKLKWQIDEGDGIGTSP